MEEDKYDFDAPTFQNFEEIDMFEPANDDLRVVVDEETKNVSSNEDLKLEMEDDDEEEDEHYGTPLSNQKSENDVHQTIDSGPAVLTHDVVDANSSIKKSAQKPKFNPPIRQSPRLAAIAKDIRRANASRGFLPSPGGSRGFLPSPGSARNHRRSLSDGSKIATNFTKVSKNSSPKKKLAVVRPSIREPLQNREDMVALQQTTSFNNRLPAKSNRRVNQATGPLRATEAALSQRSRPLETTRPTEFSLTSGSRLRGRSADPQGSPRPDLSDPSKVFTQSLRSYSGKVEKETARGPTKVKPFNLHGSTKPKESGSSFKSMAELNLRFQTATPPRFRPRTSSAMDKIPCNSKRSKAASSLTQPHTPQLTTKLRTRTVDYPTREEIEEKEAEQAQKNQFKARPLNKKILEQPASVVEPNREPTVTIPEPFDITDMRKKPNVVNIVGSDTFNPLIKEVSVCDSSVAHDNVSFVGRKRATKVIPFSFDSRDTEMFRRKKEKVDKLIEEERKLAEFHAQPMPQFEKETGLPPKPVIQATKPRPFNLASHDRRSQKLKEIEDELASLRELEKKQRQFKSQPPKSLIHPPFVPSKSDKPLTDISGFTLNSDRRAQEREEFDTYLKAKEDEIRMRKLELEDEQRKREDEEVKRMRKEAVHKAQPIRRYKPVQIKKGLIEPTVPVTPNLDSHRRNRGVASQNATGVQDATQLRMELTFDRD